MSLGRLIICFATIALAGCGGRPTPASPQSRAPSPRYVAPADRLISTSLLTFESPQDLSFVQAAPPPRRETDPDRPANHALMVASPTRIKIGALMRGREFPGPWDMVGFRLRSTSSQLDIQVGLGGPTSRLTGGAGWATAWLPLRIAAASTPADIDQTCLTLESAEAFLIDDVVLAQSSLTACTSTMPMTGESWRVARKSGRWEVSCNDRIYVSEPAAPFDSQGYGLVEACEARAVLQSASRGTLTVDRLGRVIETGRIRGVSRSGAGKDSREDETSPAHIEIVGEGGRIERSLPGDRDNDGYDELRGCYTIRAGPGGRVAIKLETQSSPVRWPVLEVHDLPRNGTVQAWCDGATVESVTRLSDGRTLIELPVDLVARAVTAEIRVR